MNKKERLKEKVSLMTGTFYRTDNTETFIYLLSLWVFMLNASLGGGANAFLVGIIV